MQSIRNRQVVGSIPTAGSSFSAAVLDYLIVLVSSIVANFILFSLSPGDRRRRMSP